MSGTIRKMPQGLHRVNPGRLAWIITALLLLLGTGTAAFAFWASTTTSNNAAAAADTLSPGSKPNVAANGTSLSVTWAAGTTVNGRAATGYIVTRYSAASGGTGTPATGGCAGTVTTLDCTEQNVPGGIWYYTVTPTIALWTGAESPRSAGASSDATAPVATVQAVSPAPNTAGWNNTSPVTVSITADDGASGSGVASITYAVDGGAKQTVSGAAATVQVSGDGTHTVSYFATDVVGNSGSAQNQTVRIDTQAPAAPAFSSVPPYVYSGNVSAVRIDGTSEAGAQISLTAGDAGAAHSVPVTATAISTGTWSATLNLGALDQGTVTYTATATDAAGNTSTAKTATSTKDTVAPAAAQALVVPAYVNISNAPAVPVSGTAEAGATVAVTAADPGTAHSVPGGATASATGEWSLNLDLRTLNQGTVTYTVTVQDVAGNTSTAVTTSDIKDTVAPVLTITAPMYVNGTNTASSVPISGTTTDAGIALNITVRDSALNVLTKRITPTGTSWSTTMDLSTTAEGSLTITAASTDAAGNTGTASATSSTTRDTAAPTVTNIAISGTGGTKSATPDTGDTITITFSERIDSAKACTGWNGTLHGTATLSDAGTNDRMTFASGNCPILLGTLSLGGNYITTTANVDFGGNGNGNGTTFVFDPTGQILTIRLGPQQSNPKGTPIAATPTTAPTLAPATTLTDLAGNPAGPGPGTWNKSGF